MYNRDYISDGAANLYSGGWRKEDKEDLIEEYELNEEEAEQICKELTWCEEIWG